MKKRIRSHQSGMALVAVTLAAVIIFGAVTLIVAKVQTNKRFTDVTVERAVVDEAAKSGVETAISMLWQAYVTSNGNTTGNWASYRVFLNNYPIPNNEDSDHSGGQNGDENDENGDGNFEIAAETVLIDENSAIDLANGANVDLVTVDRIDDITGTTLTITARANFGSETRTAVQTVRIAGLPFDGFQYAVMANNINCILCHAEFRQIELELNNDPLQFNTFDRIKIAALESLLFRVSGAHSNVAGTVYTRGGIFNQYGGSLNASDLAGSTFKGYDFTDTNGKIIQNDITGAMTQVSLIQAGVDGEGLLEQFSNLYTSYPTDGSQQTDGSLPDSFPAPYPDDDEDRVVDDAEFMPIVNSAEGSITGGVIHGVPHGSTYGNAGLPSTSNSAATDLASDGHYDGNLVLVGTDANPIVIDGKVTVNGDVMITGKVEGFGQVLAKNNAYVVGDVTYNDAPGEFGISAAGTENGFALVAGGSIMMGDYLTIRGKQHTQDNSKYPDSGFSIRTREQHRSGTKSKNGTSETLDYGYFDPGVVDAGSIQSDMIDGDGNTVPRQGQQYSFTTSELMLFNNLEVEKAVADPTYKPRFYGLRDSQPNDIYVYDSPDEHSVRYDESGGGVQLLSDYLVANGLSLDILTNASMHYMNPDSNWISEDTLRQIWWDDEQARPSSGDPFKFDGLLYSNNAIFAITSSRSRHKSNSDGRMDIRGSIIAADLGMLIPGNGGSANGLMMYYDPRVRRFFEIEDTSRVGFTRLVFRYQ